MSAAICDILGTDKEDISGKLLLIREHEGSNANFLISCIMAGELNKGCNLVLFLVHNTFGHYHNVGMRLGYNLQQLREKDCVDTVELMKLVEDFNDSDKSKFSIFSENKEDLMKNLFFCVKGKVERLKAQSKPICVIIDDLSSFLYLGVSLKDIVSFSQYCRTLLDSLGISLVILTHVVECEEQNVLAANLTHVADITVVTEGLKTGKSREVSGRMQIKHAEHKNERWNKQNVYHYKLQDKQVLVFAPGMIT